MSARTRNEIVLDAAIYHLLVQALVHGIEEVARSAIEQDTDAGRLEAVQLVHHAEFFPTFGIFGLRTQFGFHVPTRGERLDVHSAAHRGAGSVEVQMAERQEESPLSPHRKSRDSAAFPRGDRAVILVDIGQQFARHVGLVPAGGVGRSIPVPAVRVAVRANDDHAVTRSKFRQERRFLDPVGKVATCSVQQVYHREAGVLVRLIRSRSDDYVFDVLFHRSTPHGDRVHRLRVCCAAKHCSQDDKKRFQMFHLTGEIFSCFLAAISHRGSDFPGEQLRQRY